MLEENFMKKTSSNSAHKILYKNRKSDRYSNHRFKNHTKPHDFKPELISTTFQLPKLIPRRLIQHATATNSHDQPLIAMISHQ